MRRAAIILAIAAIIAAPATVFAAEPFSATLTGAAEVPPVTTDASGTASLTISDDATSIDYEVSYDSLSGPAGAAHIHFGAADVAGPVMLGLEVGDSPFSGTLTEADFQPVENGPQTWDEALQAIRDGLAYVNVHTEANPGGEIRGQLAELPDTATATENSPLIAGPGMIALVVTAIGAIVLAVSFRRLWTQRV